jgi:Ser/Thr protein kinase RdoA (MazF antagonist)
VPGGPADALLRRDAGRTLPLLFEITRWLARWHRATVSVEPLDEARVTAFLLGPLATLDGLVGDESYRRWVTGLAARIQGRPAPLVAAHNDLTMANVVWSDRHGLGVVDWGTAAPDRLPLMDFFYAVVDAVYAAEGGSRLQAFEASFVHGGRYHSFVERLRGELAQAVAVDPDLAAAAFHACFLHHAVNEQGADPTQAGPFLELVRRAGRMTAGEGLP